MFRHRHTLRNAELGRGTDGLFYSKPILNVNHFWCYRKFSLQNNSDYNNMLFLSLLKGEGGERWMSLFGKCFLLPYINIRVCATDKQGVMIVITAINYRLSQNVMALIEAMFHKCRSPFPYSSRLPVGNHWNACNKETRGFEYIKLPSLPHTCVCEYIQPISMKCFF